MSDHVHAWLTNLYVFPDSEGYEFDQPYVIEYCGDRECGARQARAIEADEALRVAREQNRSPWVSIEEEAEYQMRRKAAA